MLKDSMAMFTVLKMAISRHTAVRIFGGSFSWGVLWFASLSMKTLRAFKLLNCILPTLIVVTHISHH